MTPETEKKLLEELATIRENLQTLLERTMAILKKVQ